MANVPGLDYSVKPVHDPTKNRVRSFEINDKTPKITKGFGGGSGIIGSVISAGAGLLGSYIDHRRAEKADKRNYERYLESRRYNSPAAAAARMRAAGLDPRSVTGQIAGSAAASTPPSAEYAQTAGAIGSAGAAAANSAVAAGQMDIDSMRQAVEAEKAYSDMFHSSKSAERLVAETNNLRVQGAIIQSQQRIQAVIENNQIAPISAEAIYENGKKVGYRLYGGTLHLQHVADELRYTLDELRGEFEIGQFLKNKDNLFKTYENNVWTDFLVSATMRVLAQNGESESYYRVRKMAADYVYQNGINEFQTSNQVVNLLVNFLKIFK